MFTTTSNVVLPTTVTGSWPRPRWMTENLRGAAFSGRMTDVRYREQFVDAVTTIVNDQEMAGLDILTNGDYHHDEDLGGRSWIVYPLERLGGVSDHEFPLGMMPYPPGSILHEVFTGCVFPGWTTCSAKASRWSTTRSGASPRRAARDRSSSARYARR